MPNITEGLTSQQKQVLRFLAEARTVQAGDILFQEGQPAQGCFQVLAGEVEILAKDSDDKPFVAITAGDGDLFGLGGALDTAMLRPVTARATRMTSLLELPVNPVKVFRESFGPAPASLLLHNVVKAVCETFYRMVDSSVRLPTFRQKSFPSAAAFQGEWLGKIEAAVPKGILRSLFGERTWEAGKAILPQGTISDHFYYMDEGTVECIRVIKGIRTSMATLKAPSTFGHLSFFSNAPQPFGTVAVTPVKARGCSRRDFESFLRQKPEAAIELLDALVNLLLSRMAGEEKRLSSIVAKEE